MVTFLQKFITSFWVIFVGSLSLLGYTVSKPLKNTAKLYSDALVWTEVFTDWLDRIELADKIYDLIGFTLFIWSV